MRTSHAVRVTFGGLPGKYQIRGIDGLLRRLDNTLPAWWDENNRVVHGQFEQNTDQMDNSPGIVTVWDDSDHLSKTVQVLIHHEPNLRGDRANGYRKWAEKLFQELLTPGWCKKVPCSCIDVEFVERIGSSLDIHGKSPTRKILATL